MYAGMPSAACESNVNTGVTDTSKNVIITEREILNLDNDYIKFTSNVLYFIR